MQVIFSAVVPIDDKRLQEIVKEMCDERIDDAFIFQHWGGGWIWTTRESMLPIGGHVAGVSLSRYCDQSQTL